MSIISSLEERDKQTLSRLMDIWESAVRSIHTFLSENDITQIKLEVYQGLMSIKFLYGYYNDAGVLQGFIGAVDNLGTKFVDVNEQNEQGVEFYRHMGFHVINRSEYDGQGRPFPLLHLGLNLC